MMKYTISWKFTKNINTSLPVSITVTNRRKYFNDCVQLFLGPISTFLHLFSLPLISRPSLLSESRNLSSCYANLFISHLASPRDNQQQNHQQHQLQVFLQNRSYSVSLRQKRVHYYCVVFKSIDIEHPENFTEYVVLYCERTNTPSVKVWNKSQTMRKKKREWK